MRMLKRLLVLVLSVGLAAVVIVPNTAIGQIVQPATSDEQRLVKLIKLLDDESWEVRERATRMIGDANEGFELAMLAEVIAKGSTNDPDRGGLSSEAMSRLRIAARELFGQTPKAGLGVGFGAVRDGGVEISTVVKEVDRFPAAGMLMPGDLIVGADGRALTTSEELRAVILSHEPGQTLNLLIQRGEQVLDMDLPLGSYRLLAGAAPIGRGIADRAIAIRWARRGILISEGHRFGDHIRAEDWLSAGYPEKPGSFRASNARRWPMVVSHGSARDIYVGVGTVIRGRIEPWSNRTNAQATMDQAKRIELSRAMRMAKMQVQLFTNAITMLEAQENAGRGDGQIKAKLTKAGNELRKAQSELDTLTAEFDSIVPSP
ncbi:MAG: PDZ domain-containing protein [Phycisphaerales bacterium]|nr:PDZ domain-containing protein [Phycisphaerales bacterium]